MAQPVVRPLLGFPAMPKLGRQPMLPVSDQQGPNAGSRFLPGTGASKSRRLRLVDTGFLSEPQPLPTKSRPLGHVVPCSSPLQSATERWQDDGAVGQHAPAEVIAHILGMIDDVETIINASLVCRRWYEATLQHRAWASAQAVVRNPEWLLVGTGPASFVEVGEDLRAFAFNFVDTRTLAAIKRRRIHNIVLVGPNLHREAAHMALFAEEVAPLLRGLSLYSTPLTPAAFAALSGGLLLLERLSLHHMQLKDCTLASVVARLVSLRQLVLVDCGGLSRQGTRTLRDNNPNLTVCVTRQCGFCQHRERRARRRQVQQDAVALASWPGLGGPITSRQHRARHTQACCQGACTCR